MKTQRAVTNMITVGAIFASIKIPAIHAVLIVAGISQKIAIFHIVAVVTVITIYGIQLKITQSRSDELEFFIFRNEIDRHFLKIRKQEKLTTFVYPKYSQ